MPRYWGNCKVCKKEFQANGKFTYARYNFCSFECLQMYKHVKNDNCCLCIKYLKIPN